MSGRIEFMSDFIIENGVLKEYKGNGNIVIIPEGVTSIENSAFYDCSSLQEISIPEGVRSIGDSAFEGCSSLREIILPESVRSIGNGVFFCCSNLQKITISEGVISIGDYAFYECRSLQEITIPESVTKIGWCAFWKCSRLQEIILTIKENGAIKQIDKVLDEKITAIRSYFIPVTEFPNAHTKKLVILGYARGIQEREIFSPEVIEKNNKYIKSRKKKLFDLAITELPLLKLMLDEKMFKLEDVPALIEKVTELGNTEVAAMLLEYRETKFSEKEKEKFANKQFKL